MIAIIKDLIIDAKQLQRAIYDLGIVKKCSEMLVSLKEPEQKKEEVKKENSSSSDSEDVKMVKPEQIKTESNIILNDEYLT
jgi:hypothetical protein